MHLYAPLCKFVLGHGMPYYALLRSAMFCYGKLCYATLCCMKLGPEGLGRLQSLGGLEILGFLGILGLPTFLGILGFPSFLIFLVSLGSPRGLESRSLVT